MIKPLTTLFLAFTLAACTNDPDATTDSGPDPDARADVAPGSDAATNIGQNVAPGPDMTTTTDMTTTADMTSTPDLNTGVDLGPSPDPVATAGAVELVQEGFQFTEGPRWFPNEDVLRFTDIPATTIFELVEPDTITTFTAASQGANGLAFNSTGNMLAAEHGGRRISIYNGTTATALVDSYQGNAFNSPNDLVLRSDGIIYFTDPPYGLTGAREIDFNGLFRFDPANATVVAEWEGDSNASRPNGVVLSPTESVLYLADTQAGRVYAFDVAGDGSLTGQRDFASVAGPDGMAVDVYGNLYVAAASGIAVFAPDGTSWGAISVPRQPANCAFGGANGQTLYITARQGLYRVNLSVAGIY